MCSWPHIRDQYSQIPLFAADKSSQQATIQAPSPSNVEGGWGFKIGEHLRQPPPPSEFKAVSLFCSANLIHYFLHQVLLCADTNF